MKKLVLFLTLLFAVASGFAQIRPSEDYPNLFDTVQRSGIFTDSKTFPDSRPLKAIGNIRKLYKKQRNNPDFNLKAFIGDHFDTTTKVRAADTQGDKSITEHIRTLWPALTRNDSASGYTHTSRIKLPHPYVVPGGRFNEMYYWDSYFTILGLEENGKTQLISDMVYNYAYLIDTLGFIPNGTRTYFLSRSQPPFFFLMANLYLRNKYDLDIYHDRITHKTKLSAEFRKELENLTRNLEKEHAFWMKGIRQCNRENPAHNHVVWINKNTHLNRYYDKKQEPRPESYTEDIRLAEEANSQSGLVYQNIRSACESGWDFSSRWMDDGQTMVTTKTLDILPVDLNSLLFGMERMIARSHLLLGNSIQYDTWKANAMKRKALINYYFWDERKKFYVDYDYVVEEKSKALTLAGVYPLFFEIADSSRASKVAQTLQKKFLKDGGLVTTLKNTGQQWDYPNGWAPLQWMAVKGLQNYGHHALAGKIAKRWLSLNEQVFRKTGKMMEKYNVIDTTLMSGGGEYPTQDGFGWTNGVFLKLHHKLNSGSR